MMDEKAQLDWILSCRREAEEAKSDRMEMNKENYDSFHMKHDFSHKKAGQSTEVLSKQSMAVETIKSFFQQALSDLGEWWKAEANFPDREEGMLIRPHEITKLTNHMLGKARYFAHVGDTIQTALLGSLAISKTYGVLVPRPRFVAKKKGRGRSYKKWVEKIEDKTWEMKFSVVSPENYYPDPTGKGLYEIEDMEVDFHEVLALSEGDDAIYDRAAVMELSRAVAPDGEAETVRARETGQNITASGHRPKVKLTEFWGTIINPTTGEIERENCVATIANDMVFIRPPEPNPLWHQRRPYTASPLMEVTNSVWHKAPMDAPTRHNRALIEVYNLLVDAAMKQVHAVSQLRKDALDNPAQVADGIKPGTTLMVNSMLPVGGKVMEPLTAVTIPPEVFNIFNLMNQEFNASALTNDLRQGVMPFRAVKATEVVEASQTITSVFQGMAKNFEARQSMPELELAWMTTAQNWDKIAKDEFISLFGETRGTEMSQMEPQDVFTATVNGIKFRVFGVTLTLNKAQDYKKLTTLLQTIVASPQLLEEYIKKYDLGKTLGQIMTSLDIDKEKLEIPLAVQATMAPQQEEAPPPPGPDVMSQIPEASGLSDMMGGGSQMPSSSFSGTANNGGIQ